MIISPKWHQKRSQTTSNNVVKIIQNTYRNSTKIIKKSSKIMQNRSKIDPKTHFDLDSVFSSKFDWFLSSRRTPRPPKLLKFHCVYWHLSDWGLFVFRSVLASTLVSTCLHFGIKFGSKSTNKPDKKNNFSPITIAWFGHFGSWVDFYTASSFNGGNRHGCICTLSWSLLCKRISSNGWWHCSWRNKKH